MSLVFSPTKILDSLILMQLVIEGPLHGYALMASIEDKFGWKPSQTAIYNSLKSMENENLVSVEERIEKGRAQKIYSLTEKGRMFCEETHNKMKEHMTRDFSQLLSLVQMVSDIENIDESKKFQLQIQSILENMKQIPHLAILLLRKAPKETQTVIENTISALKKLAIKYDVQFLDEKDTNK